MSEQMMTYVLELPPEIATYRPLQKLFPTHWTASKIEANGIVQHVYRTGEGKRPLLLLHGIFMSGRQSFGDPRNVADVPAACGQCEHVLFEEAGHLIHLDALDWYVALILNWC